jgi:hypothetical protein
MALLFPLCADCRGQLTELDQLWVSSSALTGPRGTLPSELYVDMGVVAKDVLDPTIADAAFRITAHNDAALLR